VTITDRMATWRRERRVRRPGSAAPGPGACLSCGARAAPGAALCRISSPGLAMPGCSRRAAGHLPPRAGEDADRYLVPRNRRRNSPRNAARPPLGGPSQPHTARPESRPDGCQPSGGPELKVRSRAVEQLLAGSSISRLVGPVVLAVVLIIVQVAGGTFGGTRGGPGVDDLVEQVRELPVAMPRGERLAPVGAAIKARQRRRLFRRQRGS
jgi:hypothetical protein